MMGYSPRQDAFGLAETDARGRRRSFPEGQLMGEPLRKQPDDKELQRRSSDLVRAILEELSVCWPRSVDLDLAAVGLADDARNQQFAGVVQALLDQGFVTCESAEKRGDIPRFRNTLITSSGRSALNVKRFLATLG